MPCLRVTGAHSCAVKTFLLQQMGYLHGLSLWLLIAGKHALSLVDHTCRHWDFTPNIRLNRGSTVYELTPVSAYMKCYRLKTGSSIFIVEYSEVEWTPGLVHTQPKML